MVFFCSLLRNSDYFGAFYLLIAPVFCAFLSLICNVGGIPYTLNIRTDVRMYSDQRQWFQAFERGEQCI